MNTTLSTPLTTSTTVSASSCASEHDHLLAVNIVLIFISSCIFCVGTTGNILVVYIFQYKVNKRSVTEKLIVFLAYADLLQSILNPCMFTYLRITSSKKWHFGDMGCKLIPGIQKIIISVAIGIILSIAMYRCLVICRLRRLWVNATYVQLIIVLLSSISAVPYIWNLRLHGGSCQGLMEDTVLTLSLLLSEDVIFVLVLFVTLMLIYRALNDREANNVLKSQVDQQRNRKVVSILVFMTILFMITVLPRHFIILLEGFAPASFTTGNKWLSCEVESVLSLVYMCNSVYNPFIYGKLHTQFKRSVKKTMKSIRTFTLHRNEGKSFTIPPIICERDESKTPVLEKNMIGKKENLMSPVIGMQVENVQEPMSIMVVEKVDKEPSVIPPGISERIFSKPSSDCNLQIHKEEPDSDEQLLKTTFTLKRPTLERLKTLEKQTSCKHTHQPISMATLSS